MSASQSPSPFVVMPRLAPLSALVLGALAWPALADSAYSELPTTVVTSAAASGYAVDPARAPASISVITREQLEGRSYRDITDALQRLPGVFVDEGPSGKGGTGEVSIRGLDSKYTLILVDGVPQSSRQAYYNGNGSGAEFGWLPPMSAIERIEVIRGPMSTLYGSDALGGVINVITRGAAASWGGTVNLDTVIQEDSASGDQQQSQFRMSGPVTETLAATLTGSVLNRDEDAIKSGYRGYDRRDVSGQLDWEVNDANRLVLELGYGTQETEGSAEKTGRNSHLDTRRQRQTLRHTLTWGDNLATRSYIQRTEMRQNDSSYRSTYERLTANTSTVIPLENHLLTVGAEAREQSTENPDRGYGEQSLKRWDLALFAEDEWFLTDELSLTGGARWVDDEKYGSELVPRVYAVYNPGMGLTFKGGVSAGYRTPDLKQGDSNWIEGGGGPRCPDCRDVGNSDLEAEKSTSYELSAQWQSEAGLALGATLFHTDFRDKIEKPIVCDTRDGDPVCLYQGAPYTAIYQYTNVDKAEVRGAELTLNTPLGETLNLDASYTYTDSEQTSGKNAGSPLNDQPRHRAAHGLSWQPVATTELWSQARYRGESAQVAGRRGLSKAYSGYTIVDAGVRYQLTDTFGIYGGVYNLFDRDVNNDEHGRLLEGRRYNAGINVTF